MIDILFDDDVDASQLPEVEKIEEAVAAACREAGLPGKIELCIRFCDDAEVHRLNQQWRGLDKPTDVLSFPMQDGPDYDSNESLGDIVIAVPYTAHEAERLGLGMAQHTLHLIVHGTLHLLGYDHMKEDEAEVMQAAESNAMQRLGLHAPYEKQVEIAKGAEGV